MYSRVVTRDDIMNDGGKSYIIKNNDMSAECSTYGGEKSAYSILVEKPEGKKPLGRPSRRWENIKMALQEVEYRGMDWIVLALVNAIMNLRVPLNAGNFLTR
jgi:hypothetical protein